MGGPAVCGPANVEHKRGAGPMIRRTTIVLMAIAACLGVAACGSSDDSPPGDGTLSRSELAEKADAICKTGEKDAETVTAPASFDDANDAAAYFGAIVPLHQKQTDSLAALKPDADTKADGDPFMATQNANQELLDTILAKAKAKDPTGQQDLQKFTAQSQAFAAAAQKIGSGGGGGTA